MKQDNLLDALQYIDDALLESAADSMTEKKHYALWFWMTATAACVALVIGVWALLRQDAPLPDRSPVLQNNPTIMTDPIQNPIPNGPTQSCPDGMQQDKVDPTKPPANTCPDPTESMKPSAPPEEPDGPVDSAPNCPERPAGYRPPPMVEQPMEVPKNNGAGFTAEELGKLFSGYYGDTIYYEQVGFPDDILSGLASPPTVDYITIYQSTDREAAKEEAALGVLYDILPRLEKMLGQQIPIPQLVTESMWASSLSQNYITLKNYANGIEISCKSGSQYSYQSDDPALKINGITLSAKADDTDEKIMESVSAAIPYLEEVFDMDLSAYKIYRDYAFSDDMSYLSYMTVYLYSDDDVLDQFLQEYDDFPRRYLAGEVLCLNFSVTYRPGEMDTVICREIEFITQPQRWVKPLEQRKMLTLAEAEDLLDKGYIFCPHFCSICLQEQGAVDFSDYDRVSLEYVYGKDYAIPFYTFYKKLGDNADGSVRYAKTMIPAIDATGMEEYFESQLQYHNKCPY